MRKILRPSKAIFPLVSMFILATVFPTLGCQRSDRLQETTSSELEQPLATNNGLARPSPKPIKDRLDRTVTIKNQAQRIVSLSPAMTELLFALELGPNIVGATEHCNAPNAALEIPRVGGGTMESISLEAIVSAKPDLVLCKWDTHQPLVESLERLSIPCLAIGAQSLQELFEQAIWIGQVTAHESQAQALIQRMQGRRDHLVSIVERSRPEKRLKVFYEVWDSPLMTAGPNSFINEMLVLAGLENIIKDTSIRYPRISAETVIKANPDLILAPTTHFETVEISEISARPGWNEIEAVKEERIYLISGDEVSRCGPRMLDALAEIIKAAYPEVSIEDLSDEDPKVDRATIENSEVSS